MKTIVALIFCVATSFATKADNMIDSLKNHIKNKDEQKVIRLVQENPEVLQLKDSNGSNGLMLIAYSGLTEAFSKAIELKKEFSYHEAIVCGKIEVIKNYLKTNSENWINRYSNDGFTPLSLASFFNQTEIGKLLIEYKANPNIPATNASKVNALHSAVAKENLELCKLFIENNVDVNAIQMDGVTALHSAVHRNNLEMIKMLVENGADISLKMKNGDTALDIAKKEEHKEVEEYLKSLMKK